MANLTSIAQRLNDVEINNNAPVSSQTQRRVGSSVNYLLDLVGATDGDTSTTGPLGEILQPKEVISFSLGIGNSQLTLNTPTTLFQFTGSSTRHLGWQLRAGSFSAAFNNTYLQGADAIDGDQAFRKRGTPTDNGPIYFVSSLCTSASPALPTPLNIGVDIWRVYVNGSIAAVINSNKFFTLNFDCNIAPTGTNTVQVERIATVTGFNSITLSGTLEKIII